MSIILPLLERPEWFWLAGILEAEGSFMAGPPSAPNTPVVKIEMTDEDVIAHIAAMLGYSYFTCKPRQAHHKPSYILAVKGANAVFIMNILYPLMGTRRQEQISKALESRMRRKISETTMPYMMPSFSWNQEDTAIYWLAGYLEGEGCFRKNDKAAIIQIDSTDEDILVRASELMDTHVIKRSVVQENWSQLYVVNIKGYKAIEWMIRLRPLLFARRQETIKEALHWLVNRHSNNIPGKLSYDIAQDIRVERAQGVSQADLARKHNVTPAAISNIVRGKCYTDEKGIGTTAFRQTYYAALAKEVANY